MDNTLTTQQSLSPSEALTFLVNALEFAHGKGVYGIQDAVNIAAAINVLREQHPLAVEPTQTEEPSDKH